jgi:hypothetical protein
MSSHLNSPMWGNLSNERREAFQRAVSVATAGTNLVQQYVNRIIQQLVIREFGALGTLDKRPGSGSQAIVNQRTAAAMSASTAWVSDTAALTEVTGTYAQATFNYQTLATRGRVTRKIRATGRSYIDVLAEEMVHKLDDFNNQLESALFVGDSGAISAQIDGMLTQVNAVSGQVVAQTTVAAGDSLTLAKLDETIDAVKGAGNRSDLVIYSSFSGARKLNAQLQSQQQFMNETEIAAGFRVRTYDGIPIVVSTGMPDDMAWSGSTVTGLSGETANPTTCLAVVNKRYLWMEELTPATMMPLARDDSQYEQFDIFWDGACVLGNNVGAALLAGISAG